MAEKQVQRGEIGMLRNRRQEAGTDGGLRCLQERMGNFISLFWSLCSQNCKGFSAFGLQIA